MKKFVDADGKIWVNHSKAHSVKEWILLPPSPFFPDSAGQDYIAAKEIFYVFEEEPWFVVDRVLKVLDRYEIRLIGDSEKLPFTRNFKLEDIRTLLIKGFTEEELRCFCYDERDFRSVYNQLSRNSGSAEIVHRLIEYAERKDLLQNLLAWAKKHNPAKYEQYQPYL